MSTSRILVLGTRNRGKVAELAALLLPHGFQLQTLADLPQAIEIVEDGLTFADNAKKKAKRDARKQARQKAKMKDQKNTET